MRRGGPPGRRATGNAEARGAGGRGRSRAGLGRRRRHLGRRILGSAQHRLHAQASRHLPDRGQRLRDLGAGGGPDRRRQHLRAGLVLPGSVHREVRRHRRHRQLQGVPRRGPPLPAGPGARARARLHHPALFPLDVRRRARVSNCGGALRRRGKGSPDPHPAASAGPQGRHHRAARPHRDGGPCRGSRGCRPGDGPSPAAAGAGARQPLLRDRAAHEAGIRHRGFSEVRPGKQAAYHGRPRQPLPRRRNAA